MTTLRSENPAFVWVQVTAINSEILLLFEVLIVESLLSIEYAYTNL